LSIGRHVVAEQIAAVVGEPEILRLRMPVEADRIAYTAREHFGRRIRLAHVHAQNRRVHRLFFLAHIARCADRNVELSVGTEANEFPAVMQAGRQLRRDDLGLG
jgi:hypothetical protein